MKDIQIKKLIEAEKKRQKKVVNLIASENYASKDVLEALGSIFDNKYAEGYPFARYYGGQENTDKLEVLCQERALKLFKLKKDDWHVNVQPLSGGPANLAVYLAPHFVQSHTLLPERVCSRVPPQEHFFSASSFVICSFILAAFNFLLTLASSRNSGTRIFASLLYSFVIHLPSGS